MVDETTNSTTVAVLTEAELEASIEAAMKAKDLKLVISLARDLDKLTKANASAKQDEKLAALIDITTKVRKAVEKLIDGFTADKAGAKEFELADGLWIAWDFEAVREVGINPSVRLVKTAKTRKSSSTGGGQRFSIGWKELLEKYGGSPYKDSGLTCQQKWDESSEKNSRYQVRMAMLKLDGQV